MTKAHLTWVKVTDQDAGKSIAGLLDSDTLAFDTVLLVSR